MSAILEIKNIVKDFPKVRAVDDVSLSIKEGICFGLLGPNGAGKTTLIEVIEGILRPTSGEILYKGKPRKTRFKNEIGIQFQKTELPEFLTVKECVTMFRNLYYKNLPLEKLIEICQLQDIINRDNRKISGGQKQRMLLAIALVNDPELIFLDEPTTGLDPQARRHLWEIVNQIKAEGKTIILTTHYIEEAELLCDEIAIMDTGKIIAQGSPEELLNRAGNNHLIILTGNIEKELLDDIQGNWKHTQDKTEINTDNINKTINYLIRKGIDLTALTVRSQNLEDVFIQLTGKNLRE